MREQEISIRELFWEILLNWRLLILFAAVCAAAFGAGAYLKDCKSIEAQQEMVQEVTLTEEQEEQIKQVQALEASKSESETYRNASILMNIDPYSENMLVLQYYVDSDYRMNYTQDMAPDYTNAVTESYCEYVQNGDAARKLAETLGTDEQYVKELISAESSAADVFTVKVMYNGQDVLQQAADIIKAEIANQTENISESIGSHSLVLVSENITVNTDTELADRQETLQDTINYYTEQIASLKENMTEEQLAVLEEADEAGTTEQSIAETAEPELSLKNIGIGALAGIFLGAFLIFGKRVLAGRLQETNELAELYDLRLMGILRFEQGKKKSVIDKWLLKIKYRNREPASAENSMEMLAANIELLCKKEQINRLCIVSSRTEILQKDAWHVLQDRLENSGVNVIYAGNICHDVQALRKATDIGNVVIAEETGKSFYSEIEQETVQMREQGIKILGGIVAETI